MSNPFESTDRWEVGLDSGLPVLGKGNYAVEIVEANDDGASRNGFPQAKIKFVCDQGQIISWEIYHDAFLNRMASLYDKSGAQLPQEGEFDPEDKCRINQKALDRLVGKKVGVVVIEEPKQNDPDKMRSRVQGYVEASKITGDPDTRGLPDVSQPAPVAAGVSDDELPF